MPLSCANSESPLARGSFHLLNHALQKFPSTIWPASESNNPVTFPKTCPLVSFHTSRRILRSAFDIRALSLFRMLIYRCVSLFRSCQYSLPTMADLQATWI